MKFPKFPECQECPNKILQLDLFNPNYNFICGCEKLTKQQWQQKLKQKPNTIINCPKNKTSSQP